MHRWLSRWLGMALLLGIVSLTLPAPPAHADLRFTNNYPTPVWVAVGYPSGYSYLYDETIWRSMGWYRVERGQTITVYKGDVSRVNRYWYAYALAADGAEWSGQYLFRVSSEGFRYNLLG